MHSFIYHNNDYEIIFIIDNIVFGKQSRFCLFKISSNMLNKKVWSLQS